MAVGMQAYVIHKMQLILRMKKTTTGYGGEKMSKKRDWALIEKYRALIKDAEWRIGSYIFGGGSSGDPYVKTQLKKINEWHECIKVIANR